MPDSSLLMLTVEPTTAIYDAAHHPLAEPQPARSPARTSVRCQWPLA